uniref:Uncharacterized protein n=1 Tax=Knipowitschia caucasica TaxID=637954 RepID=A0AAV2L1U0_KNICA
MKPGNESYEPKTRRLLQSSEHKTLRGGVTVGGVPGGGVTGAGVTGGGVTRAGVTGGGVTGAGVTGGGVTGAGVTGGGVTGAGVTGGGVIGAGVTGGGVTGRIQNKLNLRRVDVALKASEKVNLRPLLFAGGCCQVDDSNKERDVGLEPGVHGFG